MTPIDDAAALINRSKAIALATHVTPDPDAIGTLLGVGLGLRSAGKQVEFKGGYLTVQDVESFDFSKAQIGLFSPGASVSEIYAPKAAAAGCIVIDNTSQFRYDADVPLVVPEVNPAHLTPHAEAFQAVVWHLLVSHPDLKTADAKWESVR